MVVEMVLVLGGRYFGLETLPAPADPGRGYSNTKELGRILYTDYVYPFELAAVILLVAIIAAIALTMRKRKDTKYQNPSEADRGQARGPRAPGVDAVGEEGASHDDLRH